MSHYAESVDDPNGREVTFKVSDIFLDQAKSGEWSNPVQFQFQFMDDRWVLVVKSYEAPVVPVRGNTP